jgi:hypothetical protein
MVRAQGAGHGVFPGARFLDIFGLGDHDSGEDEVEEEAERLGMYFTGQVALQPPPPSSAAAAGGQPPMHWVSLRNARGLYCGRMLLSCRQLQSTVTQPVSVGLGSLRPPPPPRSHAAAAAAAAAAAGGVPKFLPREYPWELRVILVAGTGMPRGERRRLRLSCGPYVALSRALPPGEESQWFEVLELDLQLPAAGAAQGQRERELLPPITLELLLGEPPTVGGVSAQQAVSVLHVHPSSSKHGVFARFGEMVSGGVPNCEWRPLRRLDPAGSGTEAGKLSGKATQSLLFCVGLQPFEASQAQLAAASPPPSTAPAATVAPEFSHADCIVEGQRKMANARLEMDRVAKQKEALHRGGRVFRSLAVSVRRARALRDVEARFLTMDPYVKISVGRADTSARMVVTQEEEEEQEEQEEEEFEGDGDAGTAVGGDTALRPGFVEQVTSICRDGGTEPIWPDDEQLRFERITQQFDTIVVEAFDRNRVTQDEMIGRAVLSLPPYFGEGARQRHGGGDQPLPQPFWLSLHQAGAERPHGAPSAESTGPGAAGQLEIQLLPTWPDEGLLQQLQVLGERESELRRDQKLAQRSIAAARREQAVAKTLQSPSSGGSSQRRTKKAARQADVAPEPPPSPPLTDVELLTQQQQQHDARWCPEPSRWPRPEFKQYRLRHRINYPDRNSELTEIYYYVFEDRISLRHDVTGPEQVRAAGALLHGGGAPRRRWPRLRWAVRPLRRGVHG